MDITKEQLVDLGLKGLRVGFTFCIVVAVVFLCEMRWPLLPLTNDAATTAASATSTALTASCPVACCRKYQSLHLSSSVYFFPYLAPSSPYSACAMTAMSRVVMRCAPSRLRCAGVCHSVAPFYCVPQAGSSSTS